MERLRKELTRVIIALQELSFERAGEGAGRRRDLDELDRTKLFEFLRLRTITWGSRNVIRLSEISLQGRDRETLFVELRKVVVLDESDQPELPRGLRNSQASLKILLLALAFHDLFWRFFGNPFFCLGKEATQVLNDIMSLGELCRLV